MRPCSPSYLGQCDTPSRLPWVLILRACPVCRPEFVKRVTRPLSSDGMTLFCTQEEDRGHQTNVDIRDATITLVNSTIPRFVATALPGVSSPASLVAAMHSESWGINIRWLGYMWSALPALEPDQPWPLGRCLVFVEMAARCFKAITEYNWLHMRTADENHYRIVTAVLVNLIAADPTATYRGRRLWEDGLLPLMGKKFRGFDPSAESCSFERLAQQIVAWRGVIWRRCMTVLGVRLTSTPPVCTASNVVIQARVSFPTLVNAPTKLKDAIDELLADIHRRHTRCSSMSLLSPRAQSADADESLPLHPPDNLLVEAVPDCISLAQLFRLDGQLRLAEAWLHASVAACLASLDELEDDAALDVGAGAGGDNGSAHVLRRSGSGGSVMRRSRSASTSSAASGFWGGGMACLHLGLAFQELRSVYEAAAVDSQATTPDTAQVRLAGQQAYSYLARLLEPVPLEPAAAGHDGSEKSSRPPTLDEVMDRVDLSAAHRREVVGVLVDTLDFLVAYNRNKKQSWGGSEGKAAIARVVCGFGLEVGVRLEQLWRMLKRLGKKLTEDSEFEDGFDIAKVCACLGVTSGDVACLTTCASQLALKVCITSRGGAQLRDEQAIMLYNGIGAVLRYRGQYDEALTYATKAMDLSPENTEVMASSLNNVGNILQNCHRWEESVVRYERSIAIRRALNVKDELVRPLCNLAQVYIIFKLPHNAQPLLEDALKLSGVEPRLLAERAITADCEASLETVAALALDYFGNVLLAQLKLDQALYVRIPAVHVVLPAVFLTRIVYGVQLRCHSSRSFV